MSPAQNKIVARELFARFTASDIDGVLALIATDFRDGRICAVREYLDTQHAHEVWLA